MPPQRAATFIPLVPVARAVPIVRIGRERWLRRRRRRRSQQLRHARHQARPVPHVQATSGRQARSVAARSPSRRRPGGLLWRQQRSLTGRRRRRGGAPDAGGRPDPPACPPLRGYDCAAESAAGWPVSGDDAPGGTQARPPRHKGNAAEHCSDGRRPRQSPARKMPHRIVPPAMHLPLLPTAAEPPPRRDRVPPRLRWSTRISSLASPPPPSSRTAASRAGARLGPPFLWVPRRQRRGLPRPR
jgi:hypothetical protein